MLNSKDPLPAHTTAVGNLIQKRDGTSSLAWSRAATTSFATQEGMIKHSDVPNSRAMNGHRVPTAGIVDGYLPTTSELLGMTHVATSYLNTHKPLPKHTHSYF